MQPVGVGLASRAALQRQQSNLDQTLQQGGKPVSGESFGGDVFKAALAHVIAGEHGGQQPGGVARQRRARIGAVMGGNGSDDVVSATRIDRHSSGVLGCAKAARRRRGHEHPRGKNQALAKRA